MAVQKAAFVPRNQSRASECGYRLLGHPSTLISRITAQLISVGNLHSPSTHARCFTNQRLRPGFR